MSVKQHFFYQVDQLACILGTAGKQRMFRGAGGVCHGVREMLGGTSSLMQLDAAQSVIAVLDADRQNPVRYSVYGFDPGERAEGLPGFNGQPCYARVKGYLLGNGKRLYSTALGRFVSPDPYSPFEKGGINAYVYCGGDPVNRVDVTGHDWRLRFASYLGDRFRPVAESINTGGNQHRLQGVIYDDTLHEHVGFRAKADIVKGKHVFKVKFIKGGELPSNAQGLYVNYSEKIHLSSSLKVPEFPDAEDVSLNDFDKLLIKAGYKKLTFGSADVTPRSPGESGVVNTSMSHGASPLQSDQPKPVESIRKGP